jgi:hypothetical protein
MREGVLAGCESVPATRDRTSLTSSLRLGSSQLSGIGRSSTSTSPNNQPRMMIGCNFGKCFRMPVSAGFDVLLFWIFREAVIGPSQSRNVRNRAYSSSQSGTTLDRDPCHRPSDLHIPTLRACSKLSSCCSAIPGLTPRAAE